LAVLLTALNLPPNILKVFVQTKSFSSKEVRTPDVILGVKSQSKVNLGGTKVALQGSSTK